MEKLLNKINDTLAKWGYARLSEEDLYNLGTIVFDYTDKQVEDAYDKGFDAGISYAHQEGGAR